ncbi:DUF4381 domain-containing protein [Seohaeicola saemankumensis]|nr:DUF4381 domain-containing protein [Seohaeicola saemankumensis]MCA0873043.1 DUF4381 domain-containing protein [Seohaeicola saemankumensis]
MNDTEQPVSLVGLLDQLVLPPEPAPVSMMPQTGGWLVLAALALILAGWALWAGIRRYRENAYRRAALAALKLADDDPAAIAAILRRTALAAYPRQAVASLSGADWLAFLDRTGGSDSFCSGPGQALAEAPYHPVGPVGALTETAALWIRRHDRAAVA